jgi:hypothetical protein
MTDREALEADARARLLPFEPLRRRVIRVYWTRGLLTLLLLASAAALGITAGVASMLFMLRVSGGAEGELVVRIVPLLLAFVVPLALIALGAAVVAAGILRGFGRATVLEYERRFRHEVVAPLLARVVSEARLEPDSRVEQAAVRASGLFELGEPADSSGSLLVHGENGGVAFAVSTLRVLRRGRLRRRRHLFHGLFGSIDLPGRFDEAVLLRTSAGDRGDGWPRPPRDFQPVELGEPAFARAPARAVQSLGAPLRTMLQDLASRAAAPLCVSLHGGGVALAVPVPRLFAPQRVRPNDAVELVRQAGLYALVCNVARELAALPR